jgi:hypothetical protein
MHLQISFHDCTQRPAGVRAGAKPAKGLPDSWLDAVVGVGAVKSRAYAAPGMLSRTTVAFASHAHGEQFCITVRQISNLLGTRADIHEMPAC